MATAANPAFRTEQILADHRADLRRQASEARARGYLRTACPNCGNFTLRHDGTIKICDTCGENDAAPNST